MDQDNIKNLLYMTRPELRDEIYRLKAEVERLKSHSFTDEELASMKTEIELLHAQFKRDLFNQVVEENERLCKAGDAMADEIIGCYNAEGYDPADSESLRNWNAAKEGKPSV